MKISSHPGMHLITDVAIDVINRSAVHTAYNSKGELSYFVVMVPREEFYKLYPGNIDVNVFIEGNWLQFGFGREVGRMVSKYSGATLLLRCVQDEILRVTKVCFYHHGKKIYSCTLKSCVRNQLIGTTSGIQKLAKLGLRALRTLEYVHVSGMDIDGVKLPCIQVIPEPIVMPDFDSDMVELQ